jgi:hypothetical protein
VTSGKRSIVSCLVALVALIALSCRGDPTTVLTRLEESRHVAAKLRVQFTQAVEASNRAVMADTDETSTAAARDAEQATKAVENSATALASLLAGLSYAHETQLLEELGVRVARYKKLQSRILALAVENTNLKARALSFGAGSQAADGFRDSLDSFTASLPVKDRCRVDTLVAQAVRDVREIQVLHAPHIAERDDAGMARMEQQMADLDIKARSALASLLELSPPSASPALADALAKLDQLKAVTAQVVALSRRNTNVLSLELSLRDKPALAAACDDQIRVLQEALAGEGPKTTR